MLPRFGAALGRIGIGRGHNGSAPKRREIIVCWIILYKIHDIHCHRSIVLYLSARAVVWFIREVDDTTACRKGVAGCDELIQDEACPTCATDIGEV